MNNDQHQKDCLQHRFIAYSTRRLSISTVSRNKKCCRMICPRRLLSLIGLFGKKSLVLSVSLPQKVEDQINNWLCLFDPFFEYTCDSIIEIVMAVQNQQASMQNLLPTLKLKIIKLLLPPNSTSVTLSPL
ncbi:uncharacterized protein LOC101847519 [Aplysia californica]|uniref:Uncharacterized protein LOC101847519 n=1 Tax=Aplysia californica TaxID=6500 RepID=A0ABM0K013_APLCA|nr:uncharacterized protein LOC101847519 [Aplysia californica]